MKLNKLISLPNKNKRLAFFLCFNFSVVTLFLFSYTLVQAVSNLDVELASRSVWRIHDNTGKNWGTAISIGGPNKKSFLTNAHVIKALIDNKDVSFFYLTQKGNSTRLDFYSLVAMSLTYDLALFETVQGVEHSLVLARHFDSSTEDSLYVVGYPQGSWQVVEQRGGIDSRCDFTYGLRTNKENKEGSMEGLSGSPIIDSRGFVVAVQNLFRENIIYGVKLEWVYKLFGGEIGVNCSDNPGVGRCLSRAVELIRSMAYEKGHKVAQYQLGFGGYISLRSDINLLTQSARSGCYLAADQLCSIHYHGDEGIPKNVEKARYWCDRIGVVIAPF